MTVARNGLKTKLLSLARNLWWSWHPDVMGVFRDLDPVAWQAAQENPIAFVRDLPEARFTELDRDVEAHACVNRAIRLLQEYLPSDSTWGSIHAGPLHIRPVVYVCAEFGIHESLPVYSGGLGVLAGDHVKSASDLGVPLHGVGLLYREGYFHQEIDAEGRQSERYSALDLDRLPLDAARDAATGEPIAVEVATRSGVLRARVLRIAVGRVSLVLLDQERDAQQPGDRPAHTQRLYGGDQRTRIRQELLLGVCGLRALARLGVEPGVLHMNEGHSAFAALELSRMHMQRDGSTFEEARRDVAARSVFTTHTPVEAGHDRFPPQLVEEHLGPLREQLGLSYEEFLALGRVHPNDQVEPFCMTVLGLRLAARANGVSAIHGGVSRRMWRSLWPNRREDEVPIGHVTNGVHTLSWIAPEMRELFDRNLGAHWPARICQPDLWAQVADIPDVELWETRQVIKARLIAFVRRREARRLERLGAGPEAIASLAQLLDPHALTIGFARRFATYKRADLILRDEAWLERLLLNPEQPVQVVFAGKAHPNDGPGKELIAHVSRLMRDPRFSRRIAFLEDHDAGTGRHLVQGADLWLNNPRRPLEASGTSGQKALVNGSLNLSVLDGWWAEAFDGSNGFAIGQGGVHRDSAEQDARDGRALAQSLEEEVVPLFFERDARGVPLRWIARMKRSIRTLAWRFNSDRMVMDYVRSCYVPAAGGASCEIPR